MSEPRALVVQPETPIQDLMLLAKGLVSSGLIPVRKPEQALAIILQGRELGIGPMAALNNINVIQGKPTVSPQLMLALFYRSGEAERVDITGDEDRCVVTLKRKGQPEHVEIFTAKDAELLGLLTKDNWRKQRAVMLKWRTVAAALRVVAPDIILGFYTPDEMGAEMPASPFHIIDDETGERFDSDAVPDFNQVFNDAPADIAEGEFKEVPASEPTTNEFDALFAEL